MQDQRASESVPADFPSLAARLIQRRASYFTLIDLGCSGGLDSRWRIFGERFRAIGFDASEDACDALKASERNDLVSYVAGFLSLPDDHPFALRSGGKPLFDDRLGVRLSAYIAARSARKAIEAASLDEKLNQNQWSATRLSDPGNRVYLLDTLSRRDFDDVDFVKIDLDGPDFHVLNALDGQFDRLGVLAVQLEVNFYGGADDCNHSFHNTDRFMRRHGFDLVSLDNRKYSMAALPSRFRYEMFAQTVSGRVIQADALYVRDPVANPLPWSSEKLVKLAAILSAYDLPDCAAELLIARREFLQDVIDVDAALDLLAFQVQSGSADAKDYRTYIAQFQDDPRSFYPVKRRRPSLYARFKAVWYAFNDWDYIETHRNR